MSWTRDMRCPDAERMAAWVEGSLTPVEVRLVREHLRDCPECAASERALRDLLREDDVHPEGPSVSSSSSRGALPWLIGVAALVGLVVWLASARSRSATVAEDGIVLHARGVFVTSANAPERSLSLGDELVSGDELRWEEGATVAVLCRQRLKTLVDLGEGAPGRAAPQDVAPFVDAFLASLSGRAERVARIREDGRWPRGPESGEALALRPVGEILGTRPRFEWISVPPDIPVVVELVREGRCVFRRALERGDGALAWPGEIDALERGVRYVWRVHPTGARELRSERAFYVLGAEERDGYESRVAAVRDWVGDDLATDFLLLAADRNAHRMEEAERRLRRLREASPADPGLQMEALLCEEILRAR